MDFRDSIYLMTLTIMQEAGGEPFMGQLAVGYVIMNRTKQGDSVSDVIFKKLQFSCWNTDSPTRMILDTMQDATFESAYKAACAAYFELTPDPTSGATHYLNEEVTRQIRGGTLPSWFNESRVTIRIKHHTFLRL